ncbi:hypothetical protein BC829DRAFT_476012 [Chytridium lagenaria]|nr:hypothetical protein BC829DRAFT_476012 [Chytridium lagenaria]
MAERRRTRPPSKHPTDRSDAPDAARDMTMQEMTLILVKSTWTGLMDAFAWPTTFILVYGSKTIQSALFKCLILNGAIFLGSILLFDYAIAPLAHHLASSATAISPDIDPTLHIVPAPKISGFLEGLYYLLWVYPLYVISFALNSLWYQSIADRSFSIISGTPEQKDRTYKWTSQNWNIQMKMDYFERRWAYFAGYGSFIRLPCSLCTFFFPMFVNAGLYALIFPLYIIMANRAQPVPSSSEVALQRLRFPIFWIPNKLTVLIISMCCGKRRR